MKNTWRADLFLGMCHLKDLVRLYTRLPNNELAYHQLLFSIALAAHPTTIVELGVGPGVSSLAFARVIQHLRSRGMKDALLHSCDIDSKTIGRLKRFGNLVQPHLMTTDALSAQWAVRAVPIDLLYIDADHSFEQSLADFRHFAPLSVPTA